MSLLTDQEMVMCWVGIKDPVAMGRDFADAEHVKEFARAIEAAVIAKLATVSVEPVAWYTHDGIVNVVSHIDKDDVLFTAEALAAARVQAIEEAEAAVRKAIGDCDLGWAAQKAIRALIGGKE